jgi:hypothetical protein
MTACTKEEFIRAYNKRYGVSRFRQWRHSSATIAQEWGMRPCPVCHGNDKTVSVREAPGFILAHCSRCDEAYIT